MKKEIAFIDADNRCTRIAAEITKRNGYPEFTVSGQYMGSWGQVIDDIKPANDDQRELISLWKKYHLKDVSSVHNFKEHLEGVLTRIEVQERNRDDKKLEGDDAILEKMEQEGIDEDMLEAVKAYIFIMNHDDLSSFQEAYSGQFRDDEQFAQEMAENIGAIDDSLHWPHTCIDWERAAGALMQDYSEEGGYYFRNL